MRFLLLLLPLLLSAVLAVAACGGDDDDGATSSAEPTRRPSASAFSATPTNGASVTASATPTLQPTPEPTPSPTRRNVAYDHYGVNTPDIIALTGGVTPTIMPCPYDAAEIVVDCTAVGFGRIALDVEPRGEITECRALTGSAGELLAASCLTAEPAAWFYKIVE